MKPQSGVLISFGYANERFSTRLGCGPGEDEYGLGEQFPPITRTSAKHCCNVEALILLDRGLA